MGPQTEVWPVAREVKRILERVEGNPVDQRQQGRAASRMRDGVRAERACEACSTARASGGEGQRAQEENPKADNSVLPWTLAAVVGRSLPGGKPS